MSTDMRASLEAMAQMSEKKAHRHTEEKKHVLGQRAGVPYEVERKVCSSCREVLDERPLRRMAA